MAQKKTPKQKHIERVGGPFAFYAVLIAVVFLVGISILMVVSAQSGELTIQQVEKSAEEAAAQGKVAGLITIENDLLTVALKHLATIALGIILAFIISRIDYRILAKMSIPAAIVIVALLGAVLLFGESTLGAKRWVNIAGQSLQPSEFAKPVLLVLISYALYNVKALKDQSKENAQLWAVPVGLGFVAVALIFFQPDMGTTIIIIAGLIVTYLVVELPLFSLARSLALAIAVFIGAIILIPNRRSRILSFFGSWGKDSEVPYQTLQAKLAFGSGGIFGQGPGLSRQKYYYLPESQNDFILAIIAEELGLFGSFLIIGSFLLLAWGGFRIAYAATDRLGRAIATGAVTMLLMQATLNIYSVIGLGPVTGKPLPFVTQGGSAMVGAFLLLGLLLSVSRYGKGPALQVAGISVVRSSRPVEHASQAPAQPKKERGIPSDRKERTRRISKNQAQKGEDTEDEDNLEWRWDGGTHIPGSRPRK